MDVKSTKAKTIDENLNLAATISDLRGINFVSCWKLKKKIKPFDDLTDLSYLNSMWGSFKQWSHSLKSNTNYGCRKTSTENCATVTSYTDPYMSWRRRQSKYTTFNLCYLPVHCSNNYSFFVRVMEYTF